MPLASSDCVIFKFSLVLFCLLLPSRTDLHLYYYVNSLKMLYFDYQLKEVHAMFDLLALLTGTSTYGNVPHV